MARDIRIQPNRSTTGSTQQPTIYFSGTTAASINLKVEDDGSIVFEGNNGGLFNITDSKDGLLSSVNDVSGLPIFSVYSSDKVIAGGYNQNALIVDTDKVFIGSDTRTVPSGTKLAVSGNTLVNGTLSASTLNLYTTPTLSSSNTQFLTRNTSTGNVEYNNFSSISTGDTFVTGFTYSNNNLTILQNQGRSPLTVNVSSMSGLTINGSLSATTYLGLPIDPDNYVTGGTYSNGTLTLNRQNGSVSVTGLSTGYTLTSSGISTALGYTPLSADTFVTGFTYNNNLFTLSQNQGRPDLTTTIPNFITGFTDYYVTGGTYSSDTLTLNRQNGSVIITGLTSSDTYTTGFTYSNNNLTISQNQGQSPLNVNISLMTGLTINGNLLVTGSTVIQNGLTANTIYTDYIDFNTTYVATQQEGRLHWDVDYGTLDVDLEGNNINLKVGLDNLYYIKNQSGATIDKGRVVRAAGTLGTSGRILGEYMIADGSIPYYFTLGIAGENILNGEDGYVYEFGLVRGINTTGSIYGETWVDGTILYVSPTISGGLTSVEPIEPNLKIQMAIVVDAAANGSLFVRPSLGSNLGDLHNVQTSGQTNGDLMSYNSSQGYWEYTKTLNGNYTINGDLTITGSTNVSYIDFDTTQTGTTSTEGRLFWDTNNYTLSLGMKGGQATQQIGEEIYYVVEAANDLFDGSVVSAVGTTGPTGRIIVDRYIADGSIPAIYTLGILTQNLSGGTIGYVTEFGLVRGLDTTGIPYGETWSQGDLLYVSPTIPGGLTNIKPVSPNLEILIAFLINVDSTNGIIFVRPKLGESLEELYDVNLSGTTEGDLLVYGNSSSWINSKNLKGDYSLNGNLNVTSGLTTSSITGQSFTIGTQLQDNNLENFLVTDTGGNFFTRTYDSLNYTPNLITVGLTGGTSNFTSIKSAVDSITGATSINPYIVNVSPGVYYEDTITMKSYITIVGDSSIGSIIEANNPNNPLIIGADQSMVQDFQIQGCTGTGVSAIIYSSSTIPQLNAIFYVENVRFGSNYTHVKNIGTLSGNSIIQCSNVKYGGYPFTLGFHATNDGSGVGRIQLRNVTSTNGGIVTQPDLIFAKADKPNCAFIVNGCLLTKSTGLAAGTGFWVENGGSLRLTGVNFQRWTTGIYAPQSGSSPSIDAIALNFEGCTTDVNIVHSGATGKIQGTDNYLKTLINIDAPLYEVNQDPRVISVAKKGGDFSSVKSAVDSITTSSITNRFVVEVGPGQFYENTIDLTGKPYVSIVGSNIQTTEIFPNTSSQHIIKIGINNEISFLSLNGAGVGYAGLYCYDVGDFAQAHKVSFYDCDTSVWVESNTQDTKFYGEYLDFNGEYSYGVKSIGNNGYLALANMENYYNFPSGTGITICNYATGSGGTINAFVGDNVSNGVSGTTAFLVEDGSSLNASTITVDGFTYGVRNTNVGNPVRFDVDNASIVNGELDISVERIGTFGTFGGSSSHQKIYTISEDVYWNFLDIDDGELDITRKASVTFQDGSHTDFTTLIFKGGGMGLMEGGEITTVSGFTINTNTGYGYLETSANTGIVRRIDWFNTTLTLSPNQDVYVFINENSILTSSGSRPNPFYNIILGRVVTNSTTVNFIDLTPAKASHMVNRYGTLLRNAIGPIYSTGSIVTENTGTPFTLDVSQGEYYYASNEFMPSGGTSINFTQYYRDGVGGWVTTGTTLVTNSYYDGNGALSGLTSGYYTKHTLYLVGDGLYERYFLVLGQNEYATLLETENALLPTPPTFFTDSVTQISNIYVQQGVSGVTEVEDVRPIIGFKAGGVNASSVHGNLLGLSADDHIQYLLVNGGRAMGGNLDMGGNQITNVGNVDGVDISTHADRHKFGGLDPVGTTTPSVNAIPYSDTNSTLDSWISDSSTSTKGLVKLSTSPTLSTNPIAVSITDNGYKKSITGLTYSSNILTATTVDGTSTTTTIGLKTKANTVAGTSFSGNPKKYTVVFTTPYPNTNYSISMSANINRTLTWESKTVNGFTINSNSNTSFTENIDWITTQHGES